MDYKFKKIRNNLELTQEKIAKIMKISRGEYANIEAETANIKLKYLLSYCNELNLSIDYVCNITSYNDKNNLIYITDINKEIITTRLNIIEKENNKRAKDIAEELGILKSTYSNYKNPSSPNIIQTLMLKKIAIKYNYSIDWIIGRGKEKKLSKKE